MAHVFNVFATNSNDQMAVDANVDPIEFRFERMGATPKARACFETVVRVRLVGGASEGRAHRRLDLGALGLARRRRGGDSIDRESGKTRCTRSGSRSTAAPSCRRPAKANIESAIIGLSSVLHERVTSKDGVVEQTNVHDYNLMRMSDLPDEMHVQFVDVETRPTGLGESTTRRRRDLERVPSAHR